MEKLKEYLRYEDGKLVWIKKPAKKILLGMTAGNPNKKGYLRFNLEKKNYMVHRVVWYLHHDYFPIEIDHINRDRSDNRIENLREITLRIDNAQNTKKFKGGATQRENGKWLSRITHEKKRYILGYFDTKELAEEAYMCKYNKIKDLLNAN